MNSIIIFGYIIINIFEQIKYVLKILSKIFTVLELLNIYKRLLSFISPWKYEGFG